MIAVCTLLAVVYVVYYTTVRNALWVHRKVFLSWSAWWAFQYVAQWDEFPSIGIRPSWKRPMVDFYFGPFTFSIGRHAVYTDPRTRQWDGCRGMLFPDDMKFPFEGEVVDGRVI